jgi:SAM-dependent methyltransferase
MDERFTAPFWDERYSSATRIWSGRPNPQLVAEVDGLQPGTALDAGCGEGADAIWLAQQGWRVTAVDVSAVALARAAAHTDPEIADRITWQQVDLLSDRAPEPLAHDLVNAQFMQFPRAVRDQVFAGLAASVAPGGTLLIVGHHPSDLETTMPRPQEPDLFFTAEEVAASLGPGEWDVLVAEARPRLADDPDGREITIHDAVLRARRHP